MALKPSSALFITLGLCIGTSQLWATEPTAETATTTVEEVLASPELVVPAGGASTNSEDTFESPEEAAAATARQPFVYVSGRNIDFTELQRLVHANNLEEIQALVDADPSVVNVHNEIKGWTAIYEAARTGRIEALEIMINAYGADINAVSLRGGSPVMAAAWFGQADTVRFLVENGASTTIENLAGATLYSIAKRRCPGVVEWLEEQGITE